MNIAVSRRDLLQKFDCLICNQIDRRFFSDDYSEKTPAEMEKILAERLKAANVPGHGRNNGRRRSGLCGSRRRERLLPGAESTGKRYNRSR